MKKFFSIISILFALFLVSLNANAVSKFVDVPEDSNYFEAIENISSLEIIGGVGNGLFLPNEDLTREQFAKIMISASKSTNDANLLKGSTIFPDVSSNRWSSGFINLAVKKGYIKGLPDGSFRPTASITFAEGATVLVKALGYTEEDVPGLWPQNFIEKAYILNLTSGSSFRPETKLKRKDVVLMLNTLLKTDMKNDVQGKKVDFATFVDLYKECIILANSKVSDRLSKNQILTDKGIFYYNEDTMSLDVGSKYRLNILKDKIDKIYSKISTVEAVVVQNKLETRVTYNKNGESTSMILPAKTTYYNNGEIKNYENIINTVQKNSTLLFVYDDEKIGFEYCVVIDPIYSLSEIIYDSSATSNSKFSNFPIIKKGKLIDYTELKTRDMVYSVTDYDGANMYYQVFDSFVEGKITAILPNKLSPSSISINGTLYNISKDMNLEEFNAFNVEDKVTAYLGNNEKVVKLYKMIFKTGPETECTVLGNAKTITKLAQNQVLTDKGIYYVLDSISNLEVGGKYDLVIDNDTIVNSSTKKNTFKNITVMSSINGKIIYNNNKSTEYLNMPEKTKYYYQGEEINYKNINPLLKRNASIVGVMNELNTGFEYIIIVDPVYSEPQIVTEIAKSDNKIGKLKISPNMAIIKDGLTINLSEIQEKNVVYLVTDILGNNGYILVVDNIVEGRITNILPNKLSPQSVEIENVSYTLSHYMNQNKINSSKGSYKVDDMVIACRDYEGNIVDIYDDTSDYAFILNTSQVISDKKETFGIKINQVKLLLSDGSKITYDVAANSEFYEDVKGKLVKFKVSTDGYVTLTYNNFFNSQDIIIDKIRERVSESYISDNLKIYNLIDKPSVGDAVVEMLDFKDLPHGTIAGMKILYLNRSGDFNDINILVFKDLFDKKNKFAYVVENTNVKSSSGGTSFSFNVLVDGKVYTYVTLDKQVKAGGVHRVYLDNNKITTFYDKETAVAEAKIIQAVDGRKIKINDTVYKFRDDMKVYFKNKDNDVLTMSVLDLEKNKTYESINVYLDKDIEKGGEVSVIVITE